HGSLIKAVAMIVLGILLGLVGADPEVGRMRYTFGLPQLGDGIGFVVVAMGIFAFGEIIYNLERGSEREVFTSKVRNLWPTREDFRLAWKAILRGTGIGSLLGIL